jgi:hypothetical protein
MSEMNWEKIEDAKAEAREGDLFKTSNAKNCTVVYSYSKNYAHDGRLEFLSSGTSLFTTDKSVLRKLKFIHRKYPKEVRT